MQAPNKNYSSACSFQQHIYVHIAKLIYKCQGEGVGEIMATFGSPKPYGIKVCNTLVHARGHIVVVVVDY
jgi:hypothetical protein